jgi:hypothetical protein
MEKARELEKDRTLTPPGSDSPNRRGQSWIDQITPERAEPRQRAILVCAGEAAVSDQIRRQYRRKFPGLGHDLPPQSVAQRRVTARRDVGRVSRLNTEFCDLVQGAPSDRGMSPSGP